MHPRTLPDQPTTQAGAFAESEDGRQLLVAGRGDPPLRAGDLVTIEIDGDQVIGQLTGRRASDGVTGGLVLGVVAQGGNALQVGPGPVFGPTPVTAAADADLAVLQGEVAIPLPIGTWTTGQVTVPAVMDGAAFNRHTFLCGQSGSGKTYALGLVLERLLAETDLRIVGADPNSDFVHVNEPSGLAEPGQLERMLRHGPHILGADATGRTPLRMRFTACLGRPRPPYSGWTPWPTATSTTCSSSWAPPTRPKPSTSSSRACAPGTRASSGWPSGS